MSLPVSKHFLFKRGCPLGAWGMALQLLPGQGLSQCQVKLRLLCEVWESIRRSQLPRREAVLPPTRFAKWGEGVPQTQKEVQMLGGQKESQRSPVMNKSPFILYFPRG